MKRLVFLSGLMAVAGSTMAVVFPTTGHAAFNFIPFGSGLAANTPTMHQVFASSLFSAQTGGLPARITSIGFAPGLNGTFNLGQVTINLGYTNAIPGQLSTAGGLATPPQGGGGSNFNGAATNFYSNASTSFTITAFSSANFAEMVFTGTPFDYNPANGNLLVEIIVPSETNLTLTVSRAAGGAESSRAFSGTRFVNGESPTTSTRMDFAFTPVPEPGTIAILTIGIGVLSLRKRARK